MLQRRVLTRLRRPGAFFISFILPIIVYIFIFACNDVSGCPAPSVRNLIRNPRTLSLEQLKSEVGWPQDGIWGLGSWKALWGSLGYIALSLVLYRVLPAHEVEGSELRSGGRLKYRLNSEKALWIQPNFNPRANISCP